MARVLPAGLQGTEDSDPLVPESSNPPSMADSAKKRKKKSRKSKHKDRSPPAAPANDVESSAHQDNEESARPSKRKHESEHEHEHKKKRKKKKKTKHHEAENDVNGASITVAEADQNQPAPSQSEGPISQEPPKSVQSTVDEAHFTTPSSQAESAAYETTGELNSKGRPKKQRGSRPGGKDNLKIGFYEPEEIERLEKFKLDFCNTHRIPGEQFDLMVQHSEREGTEFPCPASITSKSEFWADIYNIIPDRDRRSVYRFMRRHFQVTTQKPHEWTDQQDEELVQLHAEHGPKWVLIARLLGRSDDDVTQRWKNKLEHRNTMRRGPWSEDELRAFMKAMQEIWEGCKHIVPGGAGKDVYEMDEKLVGWGAVSNTMKNVRSRQQCADKWRKIRKAVFAKRREGFPDAVFDYTKTKAAKRSTRPIAKPSSAKSNEIVVEDDDDDDGNVGDDSLPTSAATTPAPKLGFADHQQMMALAVNAAEAPVESPSAPQHDTETNAESDSEVNGRPEEPDTPAAVNRTNSRATPVTPLSATNGQKRDAGRMSRIKEKIKEVNKSSSSKKRKRADASSEPEQDAEVEQPEEQLSTTGKQAERERKKEKKRKKKERKAQEELKRSEAEAEVAKAMTQQAAESDKKAKKNKKKRKSTDGADVVEAITAATPDKKKKKKHHKSESEAEANGATAEEPKSPKSSRKKDKKDKKQAVQKGSDESGSEPQLHENPALTPMVDEDQAESDPDDYSSDDGSIKVEGSESD